MEKGFEDFGEELSGIIDGVFSQNSDDDLDVKEIEIADDKREQILSKMDVKEMTQEEYVVFMDYGIANAVSLLHKASGRVPERSVILDLVTVALSHAIVTFNVDIAREKKASFRTHYGWKIREAVTTYFRDLEKGRKNVLADTGDEDGKDRSDKVLQSTQTGEANEEGISAYERPDWEDTNQVDYERFKKLEWCMRQVRHELPRESNLILDVEIGEVTDFEGKKIPLIQFAKLTGYPYQQVRKIKDRALLLIKQKMARKGYISILLDDEKTVEDLHKETDINEAIKSFEESEDIIATTDAKTILETIDEDLNIDVGLGALFVNGGEK